MEGFDRIDGDGSSDRDLFESLEQCLPIVEDLLSVRYELRIGFFVLSERSNLSVVDLMPSMEELDTDSIRERFITIISLRPPSMNLSIPSRRAISVEAALMMFSVSREQSQSNGSS